MTNILQKTISQSKFVFCRVPWGTFNHKSALVGRWLGAEQATCHCQNQWCYISLRLGFGTSDTIVWHTAWASCQICNISCCACSAPVIPGTFSPQAPVSDPDMHHGTCMTYVPWCMPGSLTSGFLWSRWRGKRSRHSWRMRNPQFHVSCKRPMEDPMGCNIRDVKACGRRTYQWLGEVIICHRILRDVSTYPCHSYLLLTRKYQCHVLQIPRSTEQQIWRAGDLTRVKLKRHAIDINDDQCTEETARTGLF